MDRQESDLYGLPLDEFVPARNELEKRLRKDGERERAAAVKRLPKPSVAAWAVNQASRTQPKDRRELLDASAELRDAQERLIAGDASAADLDRAARRQRAAIDTLVDAASGLLTSDGKGLGDATLARVRETLAAVAADEELAGLVEAGTLDRERHAAGLGFGLSPDVATAEPEPEVRPAKGKRGAKAGSTKAGSTKGGSARADEREARARARKRELAAARERVKAAKRGERDAAKRRKAAERDSGAAAKKLERAELAAARARAALEAATASEAEATREREAAEAGLEGLA